MKKKQKHNDYNNILNCINMSILSENNDTVIIDYHIFYTLCSFYFDTVCINQILNEFIIYSVTNKTNKNKFNHFTINQTNNRKEIILTKARSFADFL